MRDLMRYDEMWYSKCGEGGIRTPGPVTVNGFQDRRNRPLCHLSGRKIKASNSIFKKKVKLFFTLFLKPLPERLSVTIRSHGYIVSLGNKSKIQC